MKRDLWLVSFGLAVGLLSAGLIYLASAPPRGTVIQLNPPPTPAPIMVHVSGGVLQPGVYALPVGSRVQDAIQAANGARAEANLAAINLAAPMKDGDRLDIATLAPTAPPQAIQEFGSSIRSIGLPTPAPQTVEPGKVNINTAGLDELDTLPGIGPVTAQKFSTTARLMDPSRQSNRLSMSVELARQPMHV